MTYDTRLSTKFYSLHCVQYCKNNFNNIIEHVAIKKSNTVLYVGVISQEKRGCQRTLQVKIRQFATMENTLATSVGPGEIVEYQFLSWRHTRYLWKERTKNHGWIKNVGTSEDQRKQAKLQWLQEHSQSNEGKMYMKYETTDISATRTF